MRVFALRSRLRAPARAQPRSSLQRRAQQRQRNQQDHAHQHQRDQQHHAQQHQRDQQYHSQQHDATPWPLRAPAAELAASRSHDVQQR